MHGLGWCYFYDTCSKSGTLDLQEDLEQISPTKTPSHHPFKAGKDRCFPCVFVVETGPCIIAWLGKPPVFPMKKRGKTHNCLFGGHFQEGFGGELQNFRFLFPKMRGLKQGLKQNAWPNWPCVAVLGVYHHYQCW